MTIKLTKEEIKAIKKITTYLYDNEQRDWEERNFPYGHIYHDVQKLIHLSARIQKIKIDE